MIQIPRFVFRWHVVVFQHKQRYNNYSSAAYIFSALDTLLAKANNNRIGEIHFRIQTTTQDTGKTKMTWIAVLRSYHAFCDMKPKLPRKLVNSITLTQKIQKILYSSSKIYLVTQNISHTFLNKLQA